MGLKIIKFIGRLVLAMAIGLCMSISDFAWPNDYYYHNWNASQYDPLPLIKAVPYPVPAAPAGCLAVKLPKELLKGTDTNCQLAGFAMLEAMENYEVGCLYFINKDWIPTSKNPVTWHWAKYLAEGY